MPNMIYMSQLASQATTTPQTGTVCASGSGSAYAAQKAIVDNVITQLNLASQPPVGFQMTEVQTLDSPLPALGANVTQAQNYFA